ncbi:MAG: alpha/beta hydrolase [Paenibacillus sp.]|uniref:alpha/beta fold hydrolase n=1 Tax=Paenibacillus sp. TaxID=58172 RepID=UPI0025D16B51|nr:alpha/beta hydrolase [Paenibacillus sp.]MBR2564253.1 alpha/beta hydrolase [Paenibacillus sp.]
MNKIKKTGLWLGVATLTLSLALLFFPTWTPKIKGSNSIHVLEQVIINGTSHEIMIRGEDLANPVILYVHGGPGVSELPYAKKYQNLLESQFTVVNYDQRASGKSYHFFEDYSNLSADLLVEDALAVTDYITKRLGKNKVILIGHSYGTYIGTLAAHRAPEKYEAYIGIGQMADTQQSETDGWNYVMEQARLADNHEDINQLEQVYERIKQGQAFTPRDIVERYGGASRLMDSPDNSFLGMTFSNEYNMLDAIRFYKGIMYSQEILISEAMVRPLPSLITKLDLPFYFVMGDYDFMTSSHAAKVFFDQIEGNQKEFITYKDSAHYPHYEEKQRFFDWMVDTFIK